MRTNLQRTSGQRVGIRWTTWTIAAVVAAVTIAAAATASTPGAQGRSASGDVEATVRAAADALGMLRFINRVDTIGTMEFFAKGTTAALGPTDYYGSVSYLEPAMRVVMKRSLVATPARAGEPAAGGTATRGQGGGAATQGRSASRGRSAESAARQLIEVVTGTSAWNESELGAGLIPGKGVATPMPAAVKERQLLLWTLPFGAVKAAVKAGDRTRVTKENGVTVITFPFTDDLAGVTAKVTLGPKSLVSKVETQSDNPALVTETTYSGYKEFDVEVTTNMLFPGHIVRTQGGRPVLDLRTSKTDTNNPYEVFPIPDSVRQVGAN
jgi:hypothetical protein